MWASLAQDLDAEPGLAPATMTASPVGAAGMPGPPSRKHGLEHFLP